MKKYSSAWAFALTTIALAVPSALASMYEPTDLMEMANSSSAIVAGKVVGQHTERNDGAITTKVTIDVTDKIKGNTSNLITVELPGGSYQIGRYIVGEPRESNPQMYVNQNAVFFLNATTTQGAAKGSNLQRTSYSFSNSSQSYMTISDSAKGKMISNEMTGGKSMSITELKNQISASGENNNEK